MKPFNPKLKEHDCATSDQLELQNLRKQFDEFRYHLPGALIEVDLIAQRLTYMNRIAFIIFGYTPEDFTKGIEIEHLFAENEYQRAKEIILSYVGPNLSQKVEYTPADKQIIYEFLMRKKDGSIFPAETQSSFVLDENKIPTKMRTHIRDITERKRSEEALRKALSEVAQLKDRLETENVYLREEIEVNHHFGEIVGRSRPLKKVLHKVEQVAATETTVLIQGETGTGKELLAYAIHNLSARKDRPYVKVNCATLPSTLIESELFGHEKGAFTGASSRQVGRFEVADGGTIFLDEISDLPVELQTKLLRVLQEGQFERLGNPTTIEVDVRIIAATNQDLHEAVRKSKFREDLFYRLNVFPIFVPPLRQRREDIPLLVWAFVNEFCSKMGKKIESIPQNSMDALKEYSWPGNIRELRNAVERAVIITQGSTLRLNLPPAPELAITRHGTLEEVEHDYIVQILQETNWKIEGQNGAAKILGLNPATLRSRMRKLGIQRP